MDNNEWNKLNFLKQRRGKTKQNLIFLNVGNEDKVEELPEIIIIDDPLCTSEYINKDELKKWRENTLDIRSIIKTDKVRIKDEK